MNTSTSDLIAPDLIVIAQLPGSPQLSQETWKQAIEEIQTRLGSANVASIDFCDPNQSVLRLMRIAPSSISRLIVIPFSLSQVPLHEFRASLWFDGYPSTLPVFIAQVLAPKELGEWIHRACPADESEFELELVPTADAASETLDQLAAVAYWTGIPGFNAVRGTRDVPKNIPRSTLHAYLALSPHPYPSRNGHLLQGSVLERDGEYLPWRWLAPDSLATWIIGRYLDALNTHPIQLTDCDVDRMTMAALKSLTDRQYAMLPSEYTGRLDSVQSTSMGSAPLVYDADGHVPWDRIWTSFCDLAMAGGPPHRGSLLGTVPVEEIAQRLDDYQKVVAELQRGIQLASGLSTCESSVRGWVGVRCHSEAMASWMLRAIIVENILVRREENVLYLPAGPDFRIAKEIKNVITAVAKTSHYWLAHLRTHQPPNPL